MVILLYESKTFVLIYFYAITIKPVCLNDYITFEFYQNVFDLMITNWQTYCHKYKYTNMVIQSKAKYESLK